MVLHTYQNGSNEKLKTPNAGKAMEKQDHSYTAGRNVKCKMVQATLKNSWVAS